MTFPISLAASQTVSSYSLYKRCIYTISSCLVTVCRQFLLSGGVYTLKSHLWFPLNPISYCHKTGLVWIYTPQSCWFSSSRVRHYLHWLYNSLRSRFYTPGCSCFSTSCRNPLTDLHYIFYGWFLLKYRVKHDSRLESVIMFSIKEQRSFKDSFVRYYTVSRPLCAHLQSWQWAFVPEPCHVKLP